MPTKPYAFTRQQHKAFQVADNEAHEVGAMLVGGDLPPPCFHSADQTREEDGGFFDCVSSGTITNSVHLGCLHSQPQAHLPG